MSKTSDLAKHLKDAGITDPKWVATRVVLYAKQLNKLSERRCDDPTYGEADDKRDDVLEEKVRKLLAPLKVEFDGDPRGYAVKIHLPSGKSNHFGGETWGV